MTPKQLNFFKNWGSIYSTDWTEEQADKLIAAMHELYPNIVERVLGEVPRLSIYDTASEDWEWTDEHI